MPADNLIGKRFILLSLTWPILIETFFRMLFGTVDTFMLSGYSGNAVAGVGAANQYISILVILFQVVSAGSGIIISQCLGAKNYRKASEVTIVSLLFNLFFGLFISLVIFLSAGRLLGIMSFEKEIMDYAKEFLTIIGTFSFIQALSATFAATLRSYGFVKYPMLVNIGANVLNVIGNLIFIYGLFGLPVLGVKGVAISTVSSQLFGLIVIAVIFIKKVGFQFTLKQVFEIPKDTIKAVARDILRIGGPSAGENLSYNMSQIIITSIISLIGATAFTTRVYTFNLMFYIMLFALAISQATQILVGHLVGARRMDEAYKTCLRSLKISICISFAVAIIFWLVSRSLLGIFTDNKEIISMGSTLLAIAIVLEPGRAFNIVLGNCLKAAGDARFPFYMGISSVWAVAVGLSYILGLKLGLGLIGVWIAFASDEWLRGIAMLLRWRSRV